MSRQLQSLAQRLVIQLHMILRTLRLYEAHNKALLVGAENLRETINTLLALGGGCLDIIFLDGLVFINHERIRVDANLKYQVDELQREFAARELGGLAFFRPVESGVIMQFLEVLSRPIDTPCAVESQKSALRKIENLALELYDPKYLSESDALESEKMPFRTFVLHTYAKAIVLVKEYFTVLKAGHRRKDHYPLKKIVQDLADIALRKVDLLLRTTSIKDLHDYPYNHAVNTAVLSVLIGREVGLGRVQLVELGTAAMMANLGFAMLPDDPLSESKKLTEREISSRRRLALQKVCELVSELPPSDSLLLGLLVAQEHQLPHNSISDKLQVSPHIFSRIVRVANVFDALTTRRPWREGYSPDEALEILVLGSGKLYDPAIVKLLINVLGLYPLGCKVRLKSGELAIVYHNTAQPKEYGQPWVKVVSDHLGQPLQRTLIRNLSETSGPEGEIVDTYLFSEQASAEADTSG